MFKFRKITSPQCSFCWQEETIIHLFSECLCAQNIWNQTHILFSSYITIPDVPPPSAFLLLQVAALNTFK